FNAEFVRDKVGSFDTELVQEWFQAFAMNSGMTLHIATLYGTNDHHIAESCFKGLARALRIALAIDPRAANEIPSTKGSLGGRQPLSTIMAFYTVHQPPLRSDEALPNPDRFMFVRDGFHLWGFLLAPLWMAWNRL